MRSNKVGDALKSVVAENGIKGVDDALADLDRADKAGIPITGIGNTVSRIGDWAASGVEAVTGTKQTNENTGIAADFRASIYNVQQSMRRFMSDHNMSAEQQKQMDGMIQGLGSFTTANDARRSLLNAKGMMQNYLDESRRNGTLAPSHSYDTAVQALSSIPDKQAQALALGIRESGMDPQEWSQWISLVHNESSWNLNAPDGNNGPGKPVDIGPGQVELETAKRYVPGTTEADLRNPEKNLQISAQIFHALWQQYGGDRTKVFEAYNHGNADGAVPKASQDYAEKAEKKADTWDSTPPGPPPVAGDRWGRDAKGGKAGWVYQKDGKYYMRPDNG